MPENHYINNGTNGTISITDTWSGGYLTEITDDSQLGIKITEDEKKGKISPQLYFTYVKKKFKPLERIKLDRRIKRIEAAFDEATENGQNILAEKILTNLVREVRESIITAKGITKYVEREELVKYKNKIREGHISDTMLKDYTRIIPKGITDKIKKLKDIFDDFVIWHYWEEKVEEKLEKKQKMTSSEKDKMRDPVIFGIIKETDKLYVIDEWSDEYCDLSFDEIVDSIGKEKLGIISSKKININD